MTDQEVLISTLREARRIIREYIGPGPRKADQTLTRLIAVLGGFLYYLLKPEPEPVGVSVEPLGEALGPRVFPDGLWVLLGEVTEAPAVPVVLPLDVEPVALPVAAEPAEVPPEAPLDEAPPACASAKVLESAKAVASAIVVSFMVVSLG